MNLSIAIDDLSKIDFIQNYDIQSVYIKLDNITNYSKLQFYIEKLKEKRKNVYILMPYVIYENKLNKIIKLLKIIQEYNIDAISANSLGDINLIKDWTDKKIFCNYLLNVCNIYSVNFLKNLGVKRITLSPELNRKQIQNISKKTEIQLEIIIAGYFPVLISANCVFKNLLVNNLYPKKYIGEKKICKYLDERIGKNNFICKKEKFYLKDEKGYKFPVVFDNSCKTLIYNSKILLIRDISALNTINNLRIDLDLLGKKEIEKILLFYINKIQGKETFVNIKNTFPYGTTTGHYYNTQIFHKV